MSNLVALNITSVMLLLSCVTPAIGKNQDESATPRYRFQIVDRSDEKRFELNLTSRDDRWLCIYVEKWPNDKGQLHFGSKWVKLRSARATFLAHDENFGYCADENGKPCLIRIAHIQLSRALLATSNLATRLP